MALDVRAKQGGLSKYWLEGPASLGLLTRSVMFLCRSNSTRAKRRVSARVPASLMRRVPRRMVRYRDSARDRCRNFGRSHQPAIPICSWGDGAGT